CLLVPYTTMTCISSLSLHDALPICEFQVISELKAGGLGNQEKVQVLSFRALVQGEHDRAVQADRRVLQGQLQALHDQLAEAGEGNLFVDKLFQPATDGIAGIIVLEPSVVLAGLAVKGFAQAVEQGFRVGADPMGFATQLEGDFAVFLPFLNMMKNKML